jgi:pimeloyl-ACP methyl ester carboxylesterase
VTIISTGDINIAVTDVGDGPPVVLLHGLACGKRMWFHQIRGLKDRFRIIAYDQRGHGETDAPDDADRYSTKHLAQDLVGVLDALELPKVHLVGFSMGGGPALALAASAPDRVARLVLANVGAGTEDPWKSQWLSRRWSDFARDDASGELVADMLRSEFFKRYVNRRPRYRCYMTGLIHATPVAGLRHTFTEIIGKRKSLFRLKGMLSSIRVPTLIISGQHDYVCRNATRLLTESIPGATLKVIEGAGHMTPLEAPKIFNKTISDFLFDA